MHSVDNNGDYVQWCNLSILDKFHQYFGAWLSQEYLYISVDIEFALKESCICGYVNLISLMYREKKLKGKQKIYFHKTINSLVGHYLSDNQQSHK